MPNYIEFHKDGEIVPFPKIDDDMREAFGAKPNPASWYRGWYNSIVCDLAFGATREQLEERYPDLLDIIEWVYDNFTFNAYYSRS